MYLVVGLGNPGREHELSRHNVGWIILDEILGKNWQESGKANAFYLNYGDVEYIKPKTYMNSSGFSVAYAKNKHNIFNENIIVIHDDVDLLLGGIKVSFNKNSGGHNGVESIIKKINSKEFIRIRVGISKKNWIGKFKKPKNILGRLSGNDLRVIKDQSKKVKEIIDILSTEGREKAMDLYN